jgi:hypothetical protein
MALSLLAPQTWSVLDCVRTDLRALRLAIATWENGAEERNEQAWKEHLSKRT